MRLDELRRRSAESAREEAEALERHAPAAERDAEATRDLADAAAGLAQVQLGGSFVRQPGSPVASAGGSGSGSSPAPASSSGGGGEGGGFTTGPRFLTSQSGHGRQGGRILAEEWIGEHCFATTFQVPNPQNSRALVEEDFVEVPGWDCSGALGAPPGTVVYYDPEAWDVLQGIAKLSKSSTSGSVNPSMGASQRRDAGRGLVNRNAGRNAGSASGTGGQDLSFFGGSQPIATPGGSSKVVESLLRELVATQKEALGEVKKPPAGPSGTKGQRLV